MTRSNLDPFFLGTQLLPPNGAPGSEGPVCPKSGSWQPPEVDSEAGLSGTRRPACLAGGRASHRKTLQPGPGPVPQGCPGPSRSEGRGPFRQKGGKNLPVLTPGGSSQFRHSQRLCYLDRGTLWKSC